MYDEFLLYSIVISRGVITNTYGFPFINNLKALCGINKSFSVTQHPALQGESARETSCPNRLSLKVRRGRNNYTFNTFSSSAVVTCA